MNETPRRRARRGQPILAEDIARLQDAVAPGGAMQQVSRPGLVIPTYARVVADSAAGDNWILNLETYEIQPANPWDFLHVRSYITGEDLDVFKPYTLRPSVTSRAGVTFSYSTPQARTATQGEVVENQVLVPSYEVGDLIVIEQTLNLGDSEDRAFWRDVNDDGRQWAVTTE